MALGFGAYFPSYFAWLQSACYSFHQMKHLTDNICFGFKKPIIWAKRKLTGLKSHGRPVLTAQDTMEVEVTHPQVGVVNTPTMIMTNLQRNTVLGMSTANSAIPPHHHGNTVTMAAALADTALHVTPQRILGPPVLPGHTLKTNLPALMGEAARLFKEGVAQTPALPRQVPGILAISPGNRTLVVTMAVEEEARDPKAIAQPPEGRTPLLQGLKHSSSSNTPRRAILGSSDQVVKAILGDIRVLNHLMVPSRPSSSIIRLRNSNSSSSSNQCSAARPLHTASQQQPLLEVDQHSTSPNLAKRHHRDASQEEGLQQDSQPPQL